MIILLFVVTFLTSTLNYGEDVAAENQNVHEHVCDSSSAASKTNDNEQEEYAEAVKDSVEDSTGVSNCKQSRIALNKAFQFDLSQYNPPLLEQEQRPPQPRIACSRA